MNPPGTSRSYACAHSYARVARSSSTDSLEQGGATTPESARAIRRWTREETRARAVAGPAFAYARPTEAALDDLVAGYEHITGDLVRRTAKRNLIAATYRIHGDEFLPLVQRRFVATGTATNLLGELRSLPPSTTTSPVEDASVEVLDDMEHATADPADSLPGLIYPAENRPAFDPTSNRRYDRRRSNPDAAGFFDDDALGQPRRSRTDHALSR